MNAGLLMLVDSRFPAGGHAYSAGVESAVAMGDVVDVATLERYLHGRLATTGRVDASFAANACAKLADGPVHLTDQMAKALDVEYSARVPSPYLRSISRRLGRQFLRPAARLWSSTGIDSVLRAENGPHQALVLGAVVAAAGGTPADAVALSNHHLTSAITSAGVRLLGLDPIELAGVQQKVGRQSDTLGQQAALWAVMEPRDLPAWGGSLTEILGERHGLLDARMFVA